MRQILRVIVSVFICMVTLVPGILAAGPPAVHAAGCTAKGNVSFMFWGDKGEYNEQTAVIKQVEAACPGLHVTPIWDQGNYDNDLATKIGSGNAPDVFQLDWSKRLPEYVTQGALKDLTPYITKDGLDLQKTFWTACLPETQYKGHTYGWSAIAATRACSSSTRTCLTPATCPIPPTIGPTRTCRTRR
jgi:ABC-type glycerol-3-phosphate transport system substrate-binding protein